VLVVKGDVEPAIAHLTPILSEGLGEGGREGGREGGKEVE